VIMRVLWVLKIPTVYLPIRDLVEYSAAPGGGIPDWSARH
jgi:hypothetical protein